MRLFYGTGDRVPCLEIIGSAERRAVERQSWERELFLLQIDTRPGGKFQKCLYGVKEHLVGEVERFVREWERRHLNRLV